MTPRQALARCWTERAWSRQWCGSEIADAMLAALTAAGFDVVSQQGRGAVRIAGAADVTVAPMQLARCWDCGWSSVYLLAKDGRAQGTKHSRVCTGAPPS